MKILFPRVHSGCILQFALFVAMVVPAAAQREPLKLDPTNPHYLFFDSYPKSVIEVEVSLMQRLAVG